MSQELKDLIAKLASYLASHKAEGEGITDAFLSKELSEGEAFVESEIGKIGNPFLKAAAEWVYSTYQPDFAKWLSEYEGTAYDAFVAYLQKLSGISQS